MSKRPFEVAAGTTVMSVKPVRVAIKEPHPLPEREPRSILSMIAIPAVIIGLVGTMVMFYVSGVRSITQGVFPLVGLGGMAALMFSGRLGRPRKISWGEMEKNRRAYLRDLDTERDQIQKAVGAQREAQRKAHSTPRELGTIIGGKQMWSRRATSPDFLDVRMGVGVQHAPDSVVTVTWPDVPMGEQLDPVEGTALRDFIMEQRKIRDIAKVQNLRARPGFSFVGEDLDRIRALVRSVLLMLAVWHDPRDVKIMVVTREPKLWQSLVWLPHTTHDELFDACGFLRLIFDSPGALEETLREELHKEGKRGAWTPAMSATPLTVDTPGENDPPTVDLGAHWVIVDDNTGSAEAWESVVGQKGKQGITLLRVASRIPDRDDPGVGFDKTLEVFEVTERDRHRKANGSASTAGSDQDDTRPAPLLRVGGKLFAHADQLSLPRAERYARAMARHSPANRIEVSDSASGAAELLRSLGIDDPRYLDVDKLWTGKRGRGDERWADIPVGAKDSGELQSVIFRAKDFGGFGFHSVVIGTSGSGKSEFFLSLVYGIALTHSPETFNVIFVDMKFESAAQDILGIPHVAAALSNLGSDKRNLAERMRIAIDGEMARRFAMFSKVGARDANDYEEIRLAGADLEPCPVLLIVIDEYLELFQLHPKWIQLIIHIAQVGRGANVFFMLGGQRLDLSSLSKVQHSIAFRVALRAESGADSREVIQSDAAYLLPAKENGYALLKVGPRDLVKFRCFYLSGPFVKPKKKRVQQTVDMTLKEPRLLSWEYQPLAEEDAAILQSAATAEEEADEYEYFPDGYKKMKIVDVLRQSLKSSGRSAPHQPWLPPLEVSSTIDELILAYRGKPWYVDYGNNAGLVLPIAMEDIPENAEQKVYTVDVLRSNVMVAGAKGRGKTTTLMTLMCSAAMLYTPRRITFFCVGGASLAAAEGLPHVADIVSPSDFEGVTRTVAQLEGLMLARQEAFRAAKINIEDFRADRFGGGNNGVDRTDKRDEYGDVFLVVDDYADLYASNPELADRIGRMSSSGAEYGVHVMSSAGGWIHGQRQVLLQNSDVRIQLRLQNPDETKMAESSLDGRYAARQTLDEPGFGLNPALHEILIGQPQLVDTDGQRLDTRRLCAEVVRVSGVQKHATLKRLPKVQLLEPILAYDRQQRPVVPGGAASIAYAIGEQHDLLPVPMMLDIDAGMQILGRAQCGKSTTLLAIAEAIKARFKPEEAQITIAVRKPGPLTKFDGADYVQDRFAYNAQMVDEKLNTLAREVLFPRLPETNLSMEQLRERAGWTGPRHFVLIDDTQDMIIQDGHITKPAGVAMLALMSQARDIGLHVFTTRNSTNAGQMEMDAWVKAQRNNKVPVLWMDNDPTTRVNKETRAQVLPPGRGLLAGSDNKIEGVLVGLPEVMIPELSDEYKADLQRQYEQAQRIAQQQSQQS